MVWDPREHGIPENNGRGIPQRNSNFRAIETGCNPRKPYTFGRNVVVAGMMLNPSGSVSRRYPRSNPGIIISRERRLDPDRCSALQGS